MANLTLVQAITLGLQQEMEKDSRVMCLGEDVGLNGGVFRVTEGLQKRFGADRVVDTPLSESGIMGTAIGLAMAGMRPIPEIQFEGFMGPAYDQLVNHAARSGSDSFRQSVGRSAAATRAGAPSRSKNQITC